MLDWDRQDSVAVGYLFFEMPFKRQCPTCGAELTYANLPGFQRANRTRACCRRCSATPSVMKKRLAEAQERAGQNLSGNFMAAFFDRIEASLSGSAVRK